MPSATEGTCWEMGRGLRGNLDSHQGAGEHETHEKGGRGTARGTRRGSAECGGRQLGRGGGRRWGGDAFEAQDRLVDSRSEGTAYASSREEPAGDPQRPAGPSCKRVLVTRLVAEASGCR